MIHYRPSLGSLHTICCSPDSHIKLNVTATRHSKYMTSSSEEACLGATGFCLCRRRHLVGAAAALLPVLPSKASDSHSNANNYEAIVKTIHSPRPDWYEEFYASVMDSGMIAYESEIAPYKSQIFANLRESARTVLEIGIGTGPNLRYYAEDASIEIIGIDPNQKMESYARKAAVAAGLTPANFKFRQGVGEAIPLKDGSVDAVVGTLVLCSVKDVDQTLQEVKRVLKPNGVYIFVEHVAARDETILRLVQGVLDPLQQIVADGCHLTRNTEVNICNAGFSNVELTTAYLSTALIINPHLYGVATK